MRRVVIISDRYYHINGKYDNLSVSTYNTKDKSMESIISEFYTEHKRSGNDSEIFCIYDGDEYKDKWMKYMGNKIHGIYMKYSKCTPSDTSIGSVSYFRPNISIISNIVAFFLMFLDTPRYMMIGQDYGIISSMDKMKYFSDKTIIKISEVSDTDRYSRYSEDTVVIFNTLDKSVTPMNMQRFIKNTDYSVYIILFSRTRLNIPGKTILHLYDPLNIHDLLDHLNSSTEVNIDQFSLDYQLDVMTEDDSVIRGLSYEIQKSIFRSLYKHDFPNPDFCIVRKYKILYKNGHFHLYIDGLVKIYDEYRYSFDTLINLTVYRTYLIESHYYPSVYINPKESIGIYDINQVIPDYL